MLFRKMRKWAAPYAMSTIMVACRNFLITWLTAFIGTGNSPGQYPMEEQGIKELDMGQIVEQFPEVEYLSISGKPGVVIHMQNVGGLSGLRNLYCKDLFGYGAGDMEALEGLPELRELDFDSVPKEAGQYLKKHWKGKLDRFSAIHLRDENWLKDNLENPIRHWDGNEFIPSPAYRSARKCYKDTKKQLLETADRAGIEDIVRRYTQHFNSLNERYQEFIETEEREDIYAAMQRLYEECVLHGECGQADEKAAQSKSNQKMEQQPAEKQSEEKCHRRDSRRRTRDK